MSKKAIIRNVGKMLLALLLIGPSLAADEVADEQPLFYPPPPDEPRLQFLAKFTSRYDVSTGKGGFRDFVFGGEDKEASMVQKPYGVAVHDGAIFVADIRGGGYAIFDVADGSARFVRPSGAGALRRPANITIDEDGTRYVTDTAREQIVVFSADDRYVRAFGEAGQYNPSDVGISGDRLYVTDIKNHQLHILDKQTGNVLSTIGRAGSGPAQFMHPTSIAVATDGTIYVADMSNVRVQHLDADGQFIREIGGMGTAPGRFSRPKGLAIDREDNIYVVDTAFQNVQILGPDGGARMVFGSAGSARDSINLPTVVKIDYDSVEHFEKYAAPNWEIEYLVVVASQFGLNKVVVFGFGRPRD